MTKLIFSIILFMALLFTSSIPVSAQSISKNIKHKTLSTNNTVDNWVLVNIDGKWWWVLFEEDGSIKAMLAADY